MITETVPNCLTRHALVMTLFMLWHVRNCRRYYYYCPMPKIASSTVLITQKSLTIWWFELNMLSRIDEPIEHVGKHRPICVCLKLCLQIQRIRVENLNPHTYLMAFCELRFTHVPIWQSYLNSCLLQLAKTIVFLSPLCWKQHGVVNCLTCTHTTSND